MLRNRNVKVLTGGDGAFDGNRITGLIIAGGNGGGGKCAGCGTRISVRYPVIEFLTALLSGVVAWRFGFGWEAVHAINPRIVVASIKGFGNSGPYADFKAYENVAQAMGGSMSTTGELGGTPMVTGSQIGDSGTGVHLLAGILAVFAWRSDREATGHLDDLVLELGTAVAEELPGVADLLDHVEFEVGAVRDRSIVVSPHPLELVVLLDRGDQRLISAGEPHVVQYLIINREEPDGRAVFGSHIGNGGPVG